MGEGEDRCKHGLIKNTCSICSGYHSEEKKVERAVDRLLSFNSKEKGMDTAVPEETQVCKNGTACLVGPVPQPIENFQKSGITQTGRLGVCKTCMRKQMEEGRKKAAAKRGLKDIEERSKKPESEPTITLDFSGRESILEDLKRSASENFRTVEQEALYCIYTNLAIADFGNERR